MRLAIGETKGHVFKSMVIESFIIGLLGSFLGTFIGITVTIYFQKFGIDYYKKYASELLFNRSIEIKKQSIEIDGFEMKYHLNTLYYLYLANIPL